MKKKSAVSVFNRVSLFCIKAYVPNLHLIFYKGKKCIQVDAISACKSYLSILLFAIFKGSQNVNSVIIFYWLKNISEAIFYGGVISPLLLI